MTGSEALSDQDLALRAKAGDTSAFDQLVRRHKDGLYRFVRRYIGNADEAYDVLQDSFVSAWLALSRYDAARPFSTWLRAIALNKCRDRSRRLAVRRRVLQFFAAETLSETEPSADARSEQEHTEAARLIHLDKAIAGLPTFYKEPLLLTVMMGLSQQEVAAQLHTTTKAIEMRLRRARKKLAEAMSDFSPDG